MDLNGLIADPKRIVALTPMPGSVFDNVLSVVWAVGRRCNYACSYCSKEFHDRVSPHRTFDEMRTVWNNIKRAMAPRGLAAAIEFTGGEPTLNPDFLEFVRYLDLTQRRWIRLMGTTTNGTESLEYYERLTEHLDWISFSTHFEWWDEKKFMTTVLDLNRNISRRARRPSISVSVMYETWSAPKIEKIKDIIVAEGIESLPVYIYNIYSSKGITNKASQPFDYDAYLKGRGNRRAPNAPLEPAAAAGPSAEPLLQHSGTIHYADTQMTLDDGSKAPVHSQALVNLHANSFADWKCLAGQERLFINVDGMVHGGMCRIVQLGDMLGEFHLLDQPVTCDGRECTCMGDVRVTKWK